MVEVQISIWHFFCPEVQRRILGWTGGRPGTKGSTVCFDRPDPVQRDILR
jgi:hypothetical protein